MRAAVLAGAIGLLTVAPAYAHHHPRHRAAVSAHCVYTNAGHVGKSVRYRRRGDPRPRAWCAWWLRRFLDIPRSAFRAGEYNLARAFRYIGIPAHGPHVGAIVVWPHHVGLITARTSRGWKVKSGNDGHRVRNRVRSLRGAIAFRWPRQKLASQ